MIVYMLMFNVDFQGQEVLGVFSTEEKAKEAQARLNYAPIEKYVAPSKETIDNGMYTECYTSIEEWNVE